ncbi:TMEM175 family protein [Actinocatenispora rupis]|uniref:DUF1211 domain-containing protein n=1 Tax=Actinocatenispora rupis TaxID=519421 RepID=A0A8J3NH48_9ACTN|nr:TMEM175 family protein [Actinocatenispora rupis]GID15584.1 hypothetical protein Aru02nite_64730 [Actinocatenispora rupis]
MLRSRNVRTAHPRSEGGTQRLQALSDGVFAIAMTLLVLDLSTGDGHGSVAAVLHGQATHLLLYAESMVVLGVLWFGHRNGFEYVRRTDHVHTWLSLALLAVVALLPWTTRLVAAHLLDPLALTVYNASLLLVTGLDAATWWYATGPAALVADMPGRMVRVSRRLTLLPVGTYLVATGVVWLSVWPTLALDVLLPLLPISGLSYRLQYRFTR